MTYRQLRPKSLIEQPESKLSDRPLAIIARQSTTAQIEENPESLKLQIEDARQRFIAQGWSEDIITIRVAGGGKKGVSGTLRIDQRTELQETMIDIEAGTCKAVGAYSISRLFRDKYGVQSGTFMQACAKHDVLVILPDKTYDFQNENDVTMFTIYARFAAVENEQRAKLLKDAKHRKSLRGEFDGRTILAGLIVDRVKILADGKPNPSYGKFVEYPPHAKVVRRLYARFRELGGQFNVLAAEVARMPLVFPDFEEWVSPLDVKKFRHKKVAGGYHISRIGLFHLLTAVEYVGYWKVDGSLLVGPDDVPVVNHVAIVPFNDWQFAFDSLSFTTLDGLPNPNRTHGNTWVSVKKAAQNNTLAGILVSSLGTVQNTAGTYRVTEQVAGKSQRSNTLTVKADFVDALWQSRLIERIGEIDHDDFFEEQLTRLKQQHTRDLVTVDEQLARYHKEREGIQAYIKAVGATADVATLQQYNVDLLALSSHIADLETKKNAAHTEESKLAQLRDRIARMNTLMGYDGSNESSRNFIRLLTDTISLDEYSGHFFTMTIQWAAPFRQTDIAYVYRSEGSHQQWNEQDEEDLRLLFPEADKLDVLQRFPTRSWFSIWFYAYKLGLRRTTNLDTSGIPDRSFSLHDWRLVQEHGWTLPKKGYGLYWLYDVSNDIVETSF